MMIGEFEYDGIFNTEFTSTEYTSQVGQLIATWKLSPSLKTLLYLEPMICCDSSIPIGAVCSNALEFKLR